jgi:hypothetical protein
MITDRQKPVFSERKTVPVPIQSQKILRQVPSFHTHANKHTYKKEVNQATCLVCRVYTPHSNSTACQSILFYSSI